MNTVALLALLSLTAMGHEPGPEMKYRSFLTRQVRFYWDAQQDISTFAAQVRQESGWDTQARSSHATGLAQFTPPTAQWLSSIHLEINAQTPFSAESTLDWKWSLRALVCYDRYLYGKLANTGEQQWPLTLRAYNGGLGWILKERSCKGGFETSPYECCRKFRALESCRENISYPDLILNKWKQAYAGWDR